MKQYNDNTKVNISDTERKTSCNKNFAGGFLFICQESSSCAKNIYFFQCMASHKQDIHHETVKYKGMIDKTGDKMPP